jgi:hypothetical protein
MIRLLMFVLVAAALAAFSYMAWAQQPFSGGTATGTGYPTGSLPINATGTATAAPVNVLLAGTPGRITYLCGFAMTSTGTTAGTVTATITNAIGGTMNFIYLHPSSGQGFLGIAFPACIPANATNTAIGINLPAGPAATLAGVSAWGYQL